MLGGSNLADKAHENPPVCIFIAAVHTESIC